MNRLILIGNGFDLAHGMQTSYPDFLESFWESTIIKVKDYPSGKVFNNEEIHLEVVPHSWLHGLSYSGFKKSLKHYNSKLIFNNKFLGTITDKSYLQNWVDIENEYYELLKELINNPDYCSYRSILDLNKDFDKIKILLEEYLTKIEHEFDTKFKHPSFTHKIGHKIFSRFKLKDFTEKATNRFTETVYSRIANSIKALKSDSITMDDITNERDKKIIREISSSNPKKKLKQLLTSDDAINYFDLAPNQILFLSFNYTSTDFLYDNQTKYVDYSLDKKIETNFIHIHGSLNKTDNNPIIFGFGDEIDKDYKKIEQLNDNGFLKNIKSINYLETDNYKKLLEFVNDDDFQIFIFGHSCGISDRTLLNTLFEHHNCVSIKTFFHRKDEENDNYSDIVRNISRNFNDKANMRDKVVNKKYCLPLVE